MERLTDKHYKASDGYYMKCSGTCHKQTCEHCEKIDALVDRLGEIENILGNEYDLEKLSELLKAKSEGRLFVLEDSEFECDVKEKACRYAMDLSIFCKNDVNDYIYDAVCEKFTRERREQELEELKNNGL